MTIDNPVAKIKAFKNPKEIEGMKKCNIDDAVALCRFLHWMEIEVSNKIIILSTSFIIL